MIRFGIKMVYLQRYMTIFTDICMEKTLILLMGCWYLDAALPLLTFLHRVAGGWWFYLALRGFLLR